MNTQILNIQFSIFGDFKDLNPSNNEIVIALMNLFKKDGFVPSTFGEIPINTNKLVLQNRFSFSNKDGVVINIGSDRLDIIFGYNENGTYKDMDVDRTSEKAMEYISIIVDKYKKTINRVALNMSKFYDEKTSKKLENKFNSSIFLKYYKDNLPTEWSERLLYKLKNRFITEMNVGLNLNKTRGKLTKKEEEIEFDGIIALFDINTVFNLSANYSLEQIKQFYVEANSEYESLTNDIEEI